MLKLIFLVILALFAFHSEVYAAQPNLVLPFPEGTAYQCTQGPGGDFSHSGTATQNDLDFAMSFGRDVTAAADGTAYVHYATISGCGKQCIGGSNNGGSCNTNSQCPGGTCGSGGFGNHVTIDHGDFFTVYAHLNTINVSNGQMVSVGEKIGTSDNTGYSCGNHVHFGLHSGDPTINAISTPSILIDKILLKDRSENNVVGIVSGYEVICGDAGHVYESLLTLVSTPPWDSAQVDGPPASRFDSCDASSFSAAANAQTGETAIALNFDMRQHCDGGPFRSLARAFYHKTTSVFATSGTPVIATLRYHVSAAEASSDLGTSQHEFLVSFDLTNQSSILLPHISFALDGTPLGSQPTLGDTCTSSVGQPCQPAGHLAPGFHEVIFTGTAQCNGEPEPCALPDFRTFINLFATSSAQSAVGIQNLDLTIDELIIQ